MAENSQVEVINAEINKELSNPEVGRALLATTFKGLDAMLMKRAIMEGMIRGFKFKDFLEKNVYALPFRTKDGPTYSLVTSIDYARKRGMRAGIVGKDAPQYVMDGKKVISCSVTVHRRIPPLTPIQTDYVGAYTAEVYFDEYTTGQNLWNSKPRTMIAKVAEMHALRMACPEELSQMYSEEELQSEARAAREPMPQYKVERMVPAEDDEAGGFVDTTIKVEEAQEPPTKEPDEPQDSPKAQKMEIAQLLKEKKGYTSLGKSQEKIAEKVMDVTGISYEEANYKSIIEELKSL